MRRPTTQIAPAPALFSCCLAIFDARPILVQTVEAIFHRLMYQLLGPSSTNLLMLPEDRVERINVAGQNAACKIHTDPRSNFLTVSSPSSKDGLPSGGSFQYFWVKSFVAQVIGLVLRPFFLFLRGSRALPADVSGRQTGFSTRSLRTSIKACGRCSSSTLDYLKPILPCAGKRPCCRRCESTLASIFSPHCGFFVPLNTMCS